MSNDIIIDSREALAHPVTVACLRRSSPLEVNVQTLRFGDYAFTGGEPFPGQDTLPRIGIEVSTVSDLAQKINSDRFAFQVTGLIQNYDVPIILVTSLPTPVRGTDGVLSIPGSRMTFNRMIGALFAAQCRGVLVTFARSSDQDIVAGTLFMLWRYWHEGFSEHKLLREITVMRSPDAVMPLGEPLDDRIQTLMTLPGVGETRATAALQHFSSLFEIFTSSPAKLAQIPGWGPKIATEAYEFVMRGLGGKTNG